MRRPTRLLLSLIALLPLATPTLAAEHRLQIPLHDGRLHLPDLTTQLQHQLNLPLTLSLPNNVVEDINLHSLKGSLLLTALNESLSGAAQVELDNNSLILTFDSTHLPRSENAVKKSLRTFVADLTPRATAAQRRTYGLSLPKSLDPARPLVVLVPGLDSGCSNFTPIATLLQNEGYQTAFFNYPDDQPIADSATLFSEHMQALKEAFPTMRVDILAHSMGSLVARAYVEGDSYAGGIQHLILLAPPNHGTPLAKYRLLLELQEHYHLARENPNWRPSWLITDGLGEAGADLKPHSPFLDSLNSLPRRAGVQYTIIAGNQSPAYHLAAHALDRTAHLIPKKLRKYDGFRQAFAAAETEAASLRHHPAHSDGPVSLKSARLAGVSDYVVVPADHCGLQTGSPNTPPAAWPTIQDRLAR